MRICLVQPPNPQLTDPTTRFPLGLGYIEAVLKKAGHEVVVADLREGDKGFASQIKEIRPDIVAFTATTGEITAVKKLAKKVKAIDTNIRTMIGGAHATYMPEDCKGFFDQVVTGEADNSIVAMVEEPGYFYCNSETGDLDSIPFPARHEFGFSYTLYEGAGYGKGPKATSIISSRGCPFLCKFCQTAPRKVRYRSPQNVVEELQVLIKDWDCHHFRFEDDNFTLNKERLFEMCRLFEPLKIHFRCHTRSRLFDKDIARALRLAGCDEVGFGVECADPHVLEIIQKQETLEDHIKAIRLCEDAGMKAKCFFITGLPGEQDNIIELTQKFLSEAQPSKVILSRFTPYPGCAIRENPAKYGIRWMDPKFEHYWNFPDMTTVTYEFADVLTLEGRYENLHNLLWSGSGTSDEANRQREQLARYLEWLEREGGKELPTRLDTMVQADQVARMDWLKERVVGTVLEVGCNFGLVSAWCNGTAGVDINQANITLAQILAPRREFRVADARSLPYPDGTFDTVMVPDVIEHLYFSDVPVALKEALRVAKKKVLITVPDADVDASKAQSFKHEWLCTADKLAEIEVALSDHVISVTRANGFIMMEVVKC